MANTLAEYLASDGLTFELPTREALVDLIYKSYLRNGVNLTYDPEYSFVRGETFRKYLAARKSADEEVVASAGSVLNGDEIKVLKKFQDAQLLGLVLLWNRKNPKAGAVPK